MVRLHAETQHPMLPGSALTVSVAALYGGAAAYYMLRTNIVKGI
jgi:hypothetical protein